MAAVASGTPPALILGTEYFLNVNQISNIFCIFILLLQALTVSTGYEFR
ncbi:MAG: hypothetical protein ACW98F_10340 [Candidatus Hodarchaeales archaeon]|jgi:hypothetical protein